MEIDIFNLYLSMITILIAGIGIGIIISNRLNRLNRLKNQGRGNEYNYDRIKSEDKNDIDVKEINKIL